MKKIIITVRIDEGFTTEQVLRELAAIINESTAHELERLRLGSGEFGNYDAEFE